MSRTMAISAIVVALVCGVFVGRYSYDVASWVVANAPDRPAPTVGKYQ
jgi:hypothetical protein